MESDLPADFMEDMARLSSEPPPVRRLRDVRSGQLLPPAPGKVVEYPDRFVVPDGMSVWDYLHTSYHRALQEMFPREASGAALVQGVSSIPRSAPKLLASRDVSVSPYHWCKWRFRSNLIFRQAPDGITEVYSTRIVLHTLDRYRKDCGRPECRLVVTATDAVAYWRHYAANRALAGLNPWVACPPWFVAASRADGWAPPGCVWPPL